MIKSDTLIPVGAVLTRGLTCPIVELNRGRGSVCEAGSLCWS